MRDRLRRNLWLKLVSLILAYLAWTVVVGRPQLRDDFTVNVFFESGAATIVVDHAPTTVAATISGDETIFRSGQLERLSAEVDVSDLGVGEHRVFIDRSDLRNLPRGAEVESIEGPIEVLIERRITRPLDVRVIQTGSPPETHRLAGLQALPASVVVSGPASTVDALDAARTEPLDIGGRATTFSREVRIQPIDRLVTVTPDSVRVTVSVTERPATGQVELELDGLPEGWTAVPNRVVVSVTAATSVLQRALGAARVRVSTAELRDGLSAPVQVTFPGLPGDVLTLIEGASPAPAAVLLEESDAPR